MATSIFIGKKPVSSSSGNGTGLTSEQEVKVNSLKNDGNGDKVLTDDGTYKEVATQEELDQAEQVIADVESSVADLTIGVSDLITDVTNLDTKVTTLETDMNDHIDNTDIHVSTTDRNLLTSLNHNKGTFESEANLRATYPTANAGDYCICYNGTNYTMWTYSTDWVDTGIIGSVTSVNNLTGDVTLDSTNVNYTTGVTLKEEIDKKLESDNIVSGDNITVTTNVDGNVEINCDISLEHATNDDIDALF